MSSASLPVAAMAIAAAALEIHGKHSAGLWFFVIAWVIVTEVLNRVEIKK